MYTGRYPMGLRVGHDGVGEGPPRPAPRPATRSWRCSRLSSTCSPPATKRSPAPQAWSPSATPRTRGPGRYWGRVLIRIVRYSLGVALGGLSGAIKRGQALACASMGRVSRIAYVSGRLGAGQSSLAAPLADHRGHNRAGRRRVRRRRSPPPARLLAAVQADLPGGGRAPGGADPFGDVGGPVAAGEDWCASRLSTHEGIGPLLGNSEREQARNCGRAGAERPM